MKLKHTNLHPATFYFLLGIILVVCSWLGNLYGLMTVHPETGELIRVQNLLNAEGIRWFLRHVIVNFTGFAPLGMVLVVTLGVGVAKHSGLLEGCLRGLLKKRKPRRGVILSLILLSVLSNVIGDAGYILLIPLSVVLFIAVELPPVAGIIMTYVSVACGYSANIVLSTMDPLIARITLNAAEVFGISTQYVGPLCNSFFMAFSVLPLVLVIYWLTIKWLLPRIRKSKEEPIKYKPLNKKEKRSLIIALFVGGLYFFLIFWSTFSSYGILRGVSGSLIRSPFIMGVLFIISLGIALMGISYGLSVGIYRKESEVINGMTKSFCWIGDYLIIVFFASQVFALFSYSNLDKYLVINSTLVFQWMQVGPFATLLIFIFFVSIMNFFMVSAIEKWALFSFIFIPIFASLGISPEITQAAYRIGDSSTNVLTPFMFYLPLVLTYIRNYENRIGYLNLIRYIWPYSLLILLVWIFIFIFWYVLNVPFGL